MAVDPSEIEQFGYNVESRIYEETTRKLGAEAAERFFNQLPEKLTKRTKALAHQAKMLSLLEISDVQANLGAVESNAVEDANVVVDFAEHVHHDVAVDGVVDQRIRDSLNASEINHPIELHGSEFLPALEVVEDNMVTETETINEGDEWVPTERLAIFTDGIVRRHGSIEQLGLLASDKDAYIGALIALRGKVKNTKSYPPIMDVLGAMYDGDTRSQSAERFEVAPYTIGNRLTILQASIAKQVKVKNIDTYKYIEEQIRIGRGEEIKNPIDAVEATVQVAHEVQGDTTEEAVDSESNSVDVSLNNGVQTPDDTQGHLRVRPHHETAPGRTSHEVNQQASQPIISEKRLLQLKSMNNYQLHGALLGYFTESTSQSEALSAARLLDMQGAIYEDVDYAFGRSALRKLIDSDQGQMVYESLSDADKSSLRLLAAYELKKGEKPQTLKRIIDGKDSWKKTDAKRTLLTSLTMMVPYENQDEGEAESLEVVNEYTPRLINENLGLREDIDLYDLALRRLAVTPEELEGGINSVFDRSVEAGLFTETQAAYLRRRLKGSEEIEERAPDEKSAIFVFGKLADKFAAQLQFSSGAGNQEMSQVLRGLLSQFRTNKTLAQMEGIVAEAQTAIRQNTFKAINVENVPLVLAGAVSGVIECALEKSQG